MKNRIVFFLLLPIVGFGCFVPHLVNIGAQSKHIADDISDVVVADYAIVLGAHANEDGTPTPLLKERLEAGIQLYEADKVDILVVSNAGSAVSVMKEYLLERDVPESDIVVDAYAHVTTDSCDPIQNPALKNASVIFVSQTFHLSRTLYQCNKLGVAGIGYPAELSTSIDRSGTGFVTRVFIKIRRFVRESALMWLAVLNIYR